MLRAQMCWGGCRAPCCSHGSPGVISFPLANPSVPPDLLWPQGHCHHPCPCPLLWVTEPKRSAVLRWPQALLKKVISLPLSHNSGNRTPGDTDQRHSHSNWGGRYVSAPLHLFQKSLPQLTQLSFFLSPPLPQHFKCALIISYS